MITVKGYSHGRGVDAGVEMLTFPGGERHVRLTGATEADCHVLRLHHASADDLLQAHMAAILLRDTFPDAALHILIPYFPAARADHDATHALEMYVNLVAPLSAYGRIYICDPHSPVTMEMLAVHPDTHPGSLVVSSAAEIMGDLAGDYDVVVAPDAGARDRAGEVARDKGLELVVASKRRDQDTGRILSYEVDIPRGARALVVDDICDGGATFGILGRSISGAGATADLWVTHPVFSGPKERLEDNLSAYRGVYTTDSLPTWIRARSLLSLHVSSIDDHFSRFIHTSAKEA